MKGARAAKEVKGYGGDMGQEPTTGFQILRQQKKLNSLSSQSASALFADAAIDISAQILFT
jgi:hypothetical protein